MPSGVIFGEGKSLSTHPGGREGATTQTVNVGGLRINPDNNSPLRSANDLFGWRMNG